MLKFRNINVVPSDPVEKWGTEGIIMAIEQGDVSDWRKIVDSARKNEIVRANLNEAILCVDGGEIGSDIASLLHEIVDEND